MIAPEPRTPFGGRTFERSLIERSRISPRERPLRPRPQDQARRGSWSRAAAHALAAELPLLVRALGAARFRLLAEDYTDWRILGATSLRLRDDLPAFLASVRGPRAWLEGAGSAGAELPVELLEDLARLETLVGDLLDRDYLDVERLRRLPPAALDGLRGEELAGRRFTVAPSLRLLTVRFTLHEHAAALLAAPPGLEEGADVPVPARTEQRLALLRRGDAVERRVLGDAQSRFLANLRDGLRAGEAWRRVLGGSEELGRTGWRWLHGFARDGYLLQGGSRP